MDIVLWVLLFLTLPIFYVIGLVVAIRWAMRGGRTIREHVRTQLARDIQNYSLSQDGHIREVLQLVASTLSRGLPLSSLSRGTITPSPALPAQSAPQSATSQLAHPHKDWTQIELSSPLKNMDNINLLLYLGAFLIVVSAGIFVGYNFVTLSGVFKTVFLGLFAVAFYSVGLYLFMRLPKLRPAGTTFTGIGLVLLPLVGAAAYNFTSLHTHGPVVWFVTSLVTLVCYAATLNLTRQTYVAYLMAFTTLSLFESGISLVSAPVYWYGWGLALASLILLTLSRWKAWWQDTAASLTITANVFVPISLIFSAAQAGNSGLGQLGITFGLVAVFYLVMAARYARSYVGTVYWAAGASALPLSFGVGLWDTASHHEIAAGLVVVSAGYLLLVFYPTKEISALWRRTLALVAGLLPFAGSLIELYHPTGLLVCLAAAVAINAVLAQKQKEPVLALMTIVSALAVPYVFMRQYLDPALSAGHVAIAYVALSAALVWYRHNLRKWPEAAHSVGAAGYLVAMAFALVAGSISGHLPLLVTSLVIAGGLMYVVNLENAPELVYVSAAVASLGLCQLVPLYQWPDAAYAVILLLAGAALYLVGWYLPVEKRAQAFRQSGAALPFVAAFIGYFMVSSATSAYALATGGVLLFAESYRRRNKLLMEISVAVVIAAYDWYLTIQNVTNAQIVLLPWAAYFAVLAWRRWTRPRHEVNHLVIFALALLTFPIAGQALAINGQWYGLELIIIALGLLGAGMNLRYKLITYWGTLALVGEVLYQLRTVIFALPKYLISAVLGLGLLIAAIVLLQRRKSD